MQFQFICSFILAVSGSGIIILDPDPGKVPDLQHCQKLIFSVFNSHNYEVKHEKHYVVYHFSQLHEVKDFFLNVNLYHFSQLYEVRVNLKQLILSVLRSVRGKT